MKIHLSSTYSHADGKRDPKLILKEVIYTLDQWSHLC